MNRPVLLATVFIFVSAISLVPASGAAQNPSRSLPESWFDDDEWHLEVQYIIAAEELAAYHQLKTVEERANFITQFWARRDPNRATPQNEFRDEFYRRVQRAKDLFVDPGNPAHNGMETDRGRMYVTFGPPDRIDRFATAFYEIWHYTAAADAAARFSVQFSLPPIDSCDGSYRIVSPAPIASFQGVSEKPPSDAQVMHPFVEVYPSRFMTAMIPLDFSKTASVGWMLRTKSGEPVLENESPILEGTLGPARNDPLSKHLLGCRLFGPNGMGFPHPLPPGSYTFSSVVTLTSGVVQREAVDFDIK